MEREQKISTSALSTKNQKVLEMFKFAKKSLDKIDLPDLVNNFNAKITDKFNEKVKNLRKTRATLTTLTSRTFDTQEGTYTKTLFDGIGPARCMNQLDHDLAEQHRLSDENSMDNNSFNKNINKMVLSAKASIGSFIEDLYTRVSFDSQTVVDTYQMLSTHDPMSGTDKSLATSRLLSTIDNQNSEFREDSTFSSITNMDTEDTLETVKRVVTRASSNSDSGIDDYIGEEESLPDETKIDDECTENDGNITCTTVKRNFHLSNIHRFSKVTGRTESSYFDVALANDISFDTVGVDTCTETTRSKVSKPTIPESSTCYTSCSGPSLAPSFCNTLILTTATSTEFLKTEDPISLKVLNDVAQVKERLDYVDHRLKKFNSDLNENNQCILKEQVELEFNQKLSENRDKETAEILIDLNETQTPVTSQFMTTVCDEGVDRATTVHTAPLSSVCLTKVSSMMTPNVIAHDFQLTGVLCELISPI